MDSTSSNEDDEPKVCTVFSSSDYESKTVFDTIAFSVKKESPITSLNPAFSGQCSIDFEEKQQFTKNMPKTDSMISINADDLQQGNYEGNITNTTNAIHLITTKYEITESSEPVTAGQAVINQYVADPISNQTASAEPEGNENSHNLPMAKSLFADTPEVEFPVNIGKGLNSDIEFSQNDSQHSQFLGVQNLATRNSNSSQISYDYHDATYDAWIPSNETTLFLSALSLQPSGSCIPDKGHMTMPGIIYEEEFVDKVAINMQRIFGETESSKRRILSADNVSQDSNGLRELIKLGCYRSALNLTKRLLTLCGQGPGKMGHFSKHSPYSLQLWFTRISLLVRIREFTIADAEVVQFDDFEKPDMYYEYYLNDPSSSALQRKGSIVPFYFRMLGSEIPQYLRKSNETIEKLTKLLSKVNLISSNLQEVFHEDGSLIDEEGSKDFVQREKSIRIWNARKIRLLCALANASLFAKQYQNAFIFLTKLCEVDKDHETQFKSAIGRLFLQHGDLPTAQKYFLEASELRTLESDIDHVNTLVDSALILIAQNSYADALTLLKQASDIQPDNFMILNNTAVCLLYLGKVKESLSLMETTVRHNIPQSLQENVLLNLSSIYELENTDGTKKNSLLKLISEYKGDGVNLASLKMPNLI